MSKNNERRLPFCWEMTYPPLSSEVVLVGTHHILLTDVSNALKFLLDRADTALFEHPIRIEEEARMPSIREVLDPEQISVIGAVLARASFSLSPEELEALRVDEAVSLVQRAAYATLGSPFHMDEWARRYAAASGKKVRYAETPEDRDGAVGLFYVEYLASLIGPEELRRSVKRSLDNYWNGILETGDRGNTASYKSGVSGRDDKLLEGIVFELVRENNAAAAFFGALHASKIAEYLSNEEISGDGLFSPGVIAGVEVRKKIVPVLPSSP